MNTVYCHTLPTFKKYFRPESIDEAVSLLSEYGSEAKILAGGTDLLVMMRNNRVAPRYIIDIKHIREPDGVTFTKKVLKIGPLATLRQVEVSPEVQRNFPLLSEAITKMASIQIRNMGTVAGNICRASPSADTVPPLLVLEASVEIAGPGGARTVALEQFLTGPGSTILKPDEMVTGILVPQLPSGSATAFLRLSRVASDLAKVNAAAMINQRNNVCLKARIALGGVAPTAFRSRKAEELLRGKALNDRMIKEAGEIAANESRPISDVRSTEEYRHEMAGVLVARSLQKCLERITPGGEH